MEDFKYMLGTWKVVSTCYGGLVHVKVIYGVYICGGRPESLFV